VTRRADARVGPDVDRRVTFDRAVWTKPLAFAADAVLSAMSFQSYGPHARERARRPRQWMSTDGDTAGAREAAYLLAERGCWADLRRARVPSQHLAGRGRLLRRVMEDVSEEGREIDLMWRQTLDEAHGAATARTGPGSWRCRRRRGRRWSGGLGQGLPTLWELHRPTA
jgi:hypothetical protein